MTWMSSLMLAVGLLLAVGCQSLSKDTTAEDLRIPTAQAAADELQPADAKNTAPDALNGPGIEQFPAPQQLNGAEILPAIPPAAVAGESAEPSPRERLDVLANEFGQPVDPLSQSPLDFQQVKVSVIEKFPLVQSVIQEAQVAAGRQRSARGAFDVKLLAESLNMPQGFYENFRHRVKAEQATWKGGTVYGQYRVGGGHFQPWYGERDTNDGGEFKLGFVTPLLRGRAIDERRAEIARADLSAEAVDPQVQRQILESVQLSAYIYWSWVAAGQIYLTTQELLEVAEERDRAIRRQVELGNLGQTEQQQNERLIAARQAKLIEAERKLQSASIKLSLFLRDDNGEPIIPSPSDLPTKFPEPNDPRAIDLNSDVNLALGQRPELRELQLARRIVDVDLQLWENELLPNLHAVMEASKDVGAPTSSKGDKTPFELEAGLLFDVPLQRNKALGKIQSTQGKLTQIAIKQQFTADKIITEVQDAYSALMTAYDRIAITRRNVELARLLVTAEYRSFELGNSDVLRIALQEGAELDARFLEIEALLDYYLSLAEYQAAIANK